MKMTVWLLVFLGFTLPVRAGEELISNGGFETGDLTGWRTPVYNPNPWYISTAKVFAGSYSAYNPVLGTAIADTTLYQSFYPAPVTNISSAGFWYYHESNVPWGTRGLVTLLTFSDGSWIDDSLATDDPEYRLGVWTFRDLMPTLLAHSEKSLVQFGFFPKSSDAQYIDNISIIGITIVPEPAAVAIILSGTIFLAGTVRRRNQ
jgi:hypothetical protein